ncbi:MAG: hypothetical protein V7608_4931 [Hyphomicrobiales bacterium]|jgi:hypothetical protein
MFLFYWTPRECTASGHLHWHHDIAFFCTLSRPITAGFRNDTARRVEGLIMK